MRDADQYISVRESEAERNKKYRFKQYLCHF